MARITLEQIAQELELQNWKVLSTEYTNLDSELHFQCSEGHDVYASWKKMRTQLVCPVCKQNIYKSENTNIIPKAKGTNRILALDQASYTSGWAIFDNKKLVKYGIFSISQDDQNEARRFNKVKNWLISMTENWKPDVIGLEGIQYQQNIGVTTFQTLARLQGVLMEVCYELNIPFIICPTNTWRAHCGVKGKSRPDKKRSMQLIVKNLFDVSVSEDCADAIGIGKYLAETYIRQVEIKDWSQE